MIEDIKLNMFIDDGNGYIDLGVDNYYDIDSSGNLLKLEDVTWLAVSTDNSNWQVVPFYYNSSTVDGDNIITYGTIPVLYNSKVADLIVYMDNDALEVVAVQYDSNNSTVAKATTELKAGDTISFICDYYDYSGNFIANYTLNDPITIKDKLYLGDVDISNFNYVASYLIKDVYQQEYWTEPMN